MSDIILTKASFQNRRMANCHVSSRENREKAKKKHREKVMQWVTKRVVRYELLKTWVNDQRKDSIYFFTEILEL